MLSYKLEAINNVYRNYVSVQKTAMPKPNWYMPEFYTDGIVLPHDTVIKDNSMERLSTANIQKHVDQLPPGSILTIDLVYQDWK